MILFCGEALVDLVQVGRDDRNVVGSGAGNDVGSGTGNGNGASPLFRALAGGSPANTAVALARLGHDSALASRVGRDAWGALVREHLDGEGVDTSLVVDAGEPTTLAVVAFTASGDARYHFYFEATAGAAWRQGDLPATAPPGLEALHFGSMAIASASGRVVIGDFVEQVRDSAVVSLDPNVRAGVIPDLAAYRRQLEQLVGRCHLVRVSSEDLEALYPGRRPEAAARDWRALGPRLVVVSRGGDGALACFGDRLASVPAEPVRVVDTIGAGDTFSAALLDFLARAGALADRLASLDEDLVAAALAFAAVAAGVACERQGADPPTAADVAARLAR